MVQGPPQNNTHQMGHSQIECFLVLFKSIAKTVPRDKDILTSSQITRDFSRITLEMVVGPLQSGHHLRKPAFVSATLLRNTIEY